MTARPRAPIPRASAAARAGSIADAAQPKDTTMDAHETPRIGHNVPPAPLTPAEITAFLDDALTGLITRRTELIAALNASAKAHPTINDDEILGMAAENVGMANKLARTSNQRHKEQKEPFLEGGRTVDSWFKRFLAPLEAAVRPVQVAMNDYGDRKLARERAVLQRQREDADRQAKLAAEKAAVATTDAAREDAWERAADATTAAEKATKRASVRPAEMTRTYGSYGAVASVRSSWSWIVEDVALVPRDYLCIDEAKIKAAAKERDPVTGRPLATIPGITWAETTKMGVR